MSVQTGPVSGQFTIGSGNIVTMFGSTGAQGQPRDMSTRAAVDPNGAGQPPAGETPAQIFLGHADGNSMWQDLADCLRMMNMTVVHFGSESRAGRTAVDVLTEMLDRADAAVLLHTRDDETASGASRARQNVVHETGLCQGRLGFDRTIIVREEGCEPFSNLHGIQEIVFSPDSIRAAFGDVVLAVQRILRTRGHSLGGHG
jgi:predicted nucleotide-binding protein